MLNIERIFKVAW